MRPRVRPDPFLHRGPPGREQGVTGNGKSLPIPDLEPGVPFRDEQRKDFYDSLWGRGGTASLVTKQFLRSSRRSPRDTRCRTRLTRPRDLGSSPRRSRKKGATPYSSWTVSKSSSVVSLLSKSGPRERGVPSPEVGPTGEDTSPPTSSVSAREGRRGG